MKNITGMPACQASIRPARQSPGRPSGAVASLAHWYAQIARCSPATANRAAWPALRPGWPRRQSKKSVLTNIYESTIVFSFTELTSARPLLAICGVLVVLIASARLQISPSVSTSIKPAAHTRTGGARRAVARDRNLKGGTRFVAMGRLQPRSADPRCQAHRVYLLR